MAAHLKTCAQLDRAIRQEGQSRSLFDPEMRRLRGALRAECQAALLADYKLCQVGLQRGEFMCRGLTAVLGAAGWATECCCWQAARCARLVMRLNTLPNQTSWPSFLSTQKHDVETLLWKGVFYRPIEEFR